MIDVIWLGGTGYGEFPEGVSAAFAKALDQDRFRFRYVRYPGSYGHPLSYAESVIEGRRLLLEAIRATPNLVVLGGFSQGAGISGDVAAEIAAGQHPDLEVVGCALIADPSRPEGAGIGRAPAGGYGIEGQRPIFGPVKFPVYHAAAPGDPICALPEGNPLRSIADLTEWYSLSSPEAAFHWAQDLVDRARSNRWQRWWSIENIRTWGGAIGFARNYLPKPIGNGRHGEAYITEGFCRSLATAVNRGVR